MTITSEQYREGVLRTESCDMEAIRSRVTDDKIRLLHAAMGIATEAGELVDALAQDVLGVTTEEVKQKNNAKLRARYGEKFSEDAAVNRDLDKEVDALKGNTNAEEEK